MTFPMDFRRDCARAWEAMPWVLQDSAPQEQNEWLKNHLAQCDSCRAEFAQQNRLRLAISLPSDLSIDANIGLKRLLGRLDAPDSLQEDDETPYRSRSGSWMTRALVAVVMIQAIGVGVLGAKLWSEGTATPAYRTLSQDALPSPAGAIHVVPDAGMKLADWTGLLRGLQLQVVGGPNDVGAYTVVPSGSVSTSQHALRQLRATQGIRLAEPVITPP
ncbi:MAG: zf-HC2 domain-containing protein [Pseudoxanthomonas sp.]